MTGDSAPSIRGRRSIFIPSSKCLPSKRIGGRTAMEAEFEARIARGETIEPKDWMPERYRKQLTRMMSQHAHSEVVGMLPEGNWITRAPTRRRKMGLLAKVQDEAGQGHTAHGGARTAGG